MKSSIQRILIIISMVIQFGCLSTPKINTQKLDNTVKEISDVRLNLINYQRNMNDSVAGLKVDKKYHYEKICENSHNIQLIDGKIQDLSSKIDYCLDQCKFIISKLQDIDSQQSVSVSERKILKGNDVNFKKTIEAMLLLENEHLRLVAKEKARRASQKKEENDNEPQSQPK